jgi:hypothetical protein
MRTLRQDVAYALRVLRANPAFIARCPLPAARCPLPAARCPLPAARYSARSALTGSARVARNAGA